VEQTAATKVAEYNPTEAALAKLRTEFAGAKYDVTTKDGYAAARKARHQLRSLRTALEDKRKEIKAPVLQQARLIDTEAARITTEIRALEDPIDAQITAQEAAEEAKRAAAVKAEQERVAAIEKRIAEMERLPAKLVGKSGVDLGLALDALRADSPAAWAQELLPKAAAAHQAAVDQVQKMWAATVWQETEAKRIAEERAELERQQAGARAAEEKAKAEREEAERAAKERAERAQMALSEISGIRQQAIIAQIGRAGVRVGGTIECIEATLEETKAWTVDEEKFGQFYGAALEAKADTVRQIREMLAAAQAMAKKEAELRAQQDKLDAERRAKEEAEHQAKLQAEREAEAKARAEREAKAAEEERQRQEKLALERRQREEQEAREAAEREQRRQEAELQDGVELLETFLTRFGASPHFAELAMHIRLFVVAEKKAA
jgi:colicin import membrane protein